MARKKLCFTLEEGDYRGLLETAMTAGLTVSELLWIITGVLGDRLRWIVEEGRVLNDYYKTLVNMGVAPGEALRNTINLLLEYGESFRNIALGLMEYLEAGEHELVIVDADWLRNKEGFFFHLTPTIHSNHLFDDLILQIQRGWDGYMQAARYFYSDDYGNKLEEVVDKLNDAVEELADEDWIEDVEEEFMDCADMAEFEPMVDYDRDMGEVTLTLSIYTSDWQCLPTVGRLDELFKKIIESAGIRTR